MHHRLALALTLALSLVPSLGAAESFTVRTGTITKVSDGDTVWFEPQTVTPNFFQEFLPPRAPTRLTLRLLGMDTPELHLSVPGVGVVAQEPWGEMASSEMKARLPLGSHVSIHDFGKDVYGRTLATIFREGQDINLMMTKAGWAAPYPFCSPPDCGANFLEVQRVREYVEACENARAAGLGIFNEGGALEEMPFEFRLRMGNRKPDKYVGDLSGGKLHAPADYAAVDTCRRVFFARVADAQRLGYDWKP